MRRLENNKRAMHKGKKLKVVILAGGFGTRISEESHLKPKPMIEIGDQPILWHIMKIYSSYGYKDFIICAGYKQHLIKEYFANYFVHNSDITFDFSDHGKMIIHNNIAEPWKVTVVDTGLQTMTGGRIKRIKDYVCEEPFMLTYGDGVCDVNLNDLVSFHNAHKRLATLTAIQPGGRYGTIEIANNKEVSCFTEKRKEDGGWVNGGFMVLNPAVIDYIDDDRTIFERSPLEKLSQEGQLMAYSHGGFWQCMDTMRDKVMLEELWGNGTAPWKVW
jgi:glucose-1-phosphate cytidylyltransferase